MDRRTILAILAFLGVYYVYFFLIRPMVYPEPTEELVATAAQAETSSGEAAAPAGDPAPAPAPAASTVAVPERQVSFSACGWTGTVDSRGGVLKSAKLADHEAPYNVTPVYSYLLGLVTGGPTTWRPYGEKPGLQPIASDASRYLAVGTGAPGTPPPPVFIEPQGEAMVLRATSPDGVEIVRTIRPNKLDPCTIDVEVTWKNVGPQRFGGPLWVGVHDQIDTPIDAYGHFFKPYWSVDGVWNSYSFPKTGGYLGLYAVLDDPDPQDGVVDWFAMSDGYFAFVLVPRGAARGQLVVDTIPRGADQEPLYGAHYVVYGGLDAGAAVTQTFSVYAGPNTTDILSAVHPSLYSLVDLGWFALFGWPLHWLLSTYHSFTGNWGLSIMLLTLTVKLLFFPLTQMAYISGQRMQALQPMLKDLRDKYGENQEELNRRTMALFRENNVNPLGGCLPMIVQMPIWIALYRVLLTSVDLYHTEFLYLRDLSVADPYALLPILVTGLMWVQQQMMPVGNMDPAQARIMKFMPLIFGLLFFSFPSGLALYTFVNMSLTILQQWVIKRRYAQIKPAPPAAA